MNSLVICAAALVALAAFLLLWSALRLHARTDPDYRKLGEASLRHEHDRANVGRRS